MAKKKTVTKKVKKKKWFPIIAPKLFNEKVLGECLLTDSELMKGRHITLNMMNITGDPKKQSTNLQFLIRNVIDGKGMTELVKYEMSNSFVKRLIRRGKNKVDDSFLTKTMDGKVVRVKPLAITLKNTNKSVLSSLRLELRKVIKEKFSKLTFSQIIESLIQYKLQRELKTSVVKIYPLRTCEIRSFSTNIRKYLGEAQSGEAPSESESELKDVKVEEAQSNEVASAPETKSQSVPIVEAKEEAKEEVVEEKAPVKKEAKPKAEKKTPAKK
jgi:small subunit ribosomal protein S3Ae